MWAPPCFDTKLKTKSDELTDIYNELDSHIAHFLGQWSITVS